MICQFLSPAQAVVKEVPQQVGGEHGVAPELPGVERAGKRPGRAAVVTVGHAGLPVVGRDRVELSPSDDDVVRVRRIHGDGRLVGRVADDVVLSGVDVDLNALDRPTRDDRARRPRLGRAVDRNERRRDAALLVARAHADDLAGVGVGAGSGQERQSRQHEQGNDRQKPRTFRDQRACAHDVPLRVVAVE